MEGHDAELILLAGVMLAAGVAGALLAERVRVPGLLLFLGLGMVAGLVLTGVGLDDAEIGRTLGTVALVLILFDGGLTSGWREIRPVLGTAASLATVGTLATAVLAGLAAKVIFGLSTLDGLLVGSAIAATDSAAIFAVLRHSTIERRLARSLEGESGMNDPVAVLLVIGFIDWIQQPGYGVAQMAELLALKLALGMVIGVGFGWLASRTLQWLRLPSDGLYPVATLAIAGLAFGLAELGHGSGFLAVYLAGLAIGGERMPARRTLLSFHEGLGWLAQISLFILLGLLVTPEELDEVALHGLALSAALILVARPLATLAATALSPFDFRERLMLGWAGLRGATPIWLATFPVVAGVAAGEQLFAIVFFVVVTSTLVQGTTFEPLATRLGLTTDEPALPRRLFESGRIRRLGGDVIAYRLPAGAAAAGHCVRDLELPRQALVNVIVRDENAIPPRGSTELREGDELHILVRSELRERVEELTELWDKGPIGRPAPAPLPRRAASQVFTVRPIKEGEGEEPAEIDGIPVVAVLRSHGGSSGTLAVLADGRFAVVGSGVVAVGGRRALAGWCERRAERNGIDPEERAWWQEVTGALIARG